MSFFLNWICRILILLVGIKGNLIGLVIFSKESFRKRLRSYIIYISIALVDLIYLFYAISKDILNNLAISLSSISNQSCKIIKFLNYALGPNLAWLLVFISIEKFLSIRFPRFKLIKRVSYQVTIILVIIHINLLVYMPILSMSVLIINYDNLTNETTKVCRFEHSSQYALVNLVDFFNSTLLPALFMFVFSILLITTIFRSRARVMRLNNLNKNKILFRKDAKFAISSIVLNVFFIILNAPICIGNFIDTLADDSDLFQSFYCIYYVSFCVNFHVLYFTNSIFRHQVHSFFKVKRYKHKNSSYF